MKKIFTIFAAATLLAAPAANAQGFLDKLKERAGAALSEKMGIMPEESVSEEAAIEQSAAGDTQDGMFSVPGSKQALQPKRSSSFGWHDAVTPSKTSFPIPLMNEFPAIPSAAQLANPDEQTQIAFYRAIKAVTLRAEELNSDTTCEDSFTEKWRADAERNIQDAFGLTAAEMEALNSGRLSPEEEERINAKVRAKLLGGVDLSMFDKEMAESETMSGDDFMKASMNASFAIFDKYDAQLRKYFGCTAEEYKAATRESMKNENSAASRALEKKGEAYMKTLDAATQKEAKAFQSKLQKEIMQASMNAVPGAGSMMQMSRNMADIQNSLAPMMEKIQKLQKYTEEIAAVMPAQDTWDDNNAKFSEAERKKIEAIKSKINATDDPSVYNPLYLQAMEMVRTYRDRAAQAWRADVQARFDNIKGSLGKVIKVNRQAIEDGVIPECALWRLPLNMVISAGDVLSESFSSFPCNYPPMYSDNVARKVELKEGEYPWWPEFYVSSDLDDIFNGKNIYKEGPDGCIYQSTGNGWSAVPENVVEEMQTAQNTLQSASWTSSDGKRTVIYNANGGFLQLPEGDLIYPLAWEKVGNKLTWAQNETVLNEDGTTTVKIIKCTYKL